VKQDNVRLLRKHSRCKGCNLINGRSIVAFVIVVCNGTRLKRTNKINYVASIPVSGKHVV
jgi:hypothetical protein